MITAVATREPLSDDEAAWLMKIYTLRKKDLFYAGAFRCFARCMPLAFTLVFAWGFLSGEFWNNKSTVIRSMQTFIVVSVGLSFVITTIVCWFINTYMIIPYQKDALCGQKLRISQKIMAKEYYPVTRQYFFRLEHNYEKLYEVDEDTYNSLNENDALQMYQCINSKHIFGDNDDVTIKFFTMRWSSSRY